MPQTVHRQCTLCEAHCGIDVEVDGDRVLRITGDAQDPISRGYICPKAAALADLYEDPDRLRRPVRRVRSEWVPIGWDEALDLAADGLRVLAVAERHDVGADLDDSTVAELTLLGFVAVADTPRPDAVHALRRLQRLACAVLERRASRHEKLRGDGNRPERQT